MIFSLTLFYDLSGFIPAASFHGELSTENICTDRYCAEKCMKVYIITPKLICRVNFIISCLLICCHYLYF